VDREFHPECLRAVNLDKEDQWDSQVNLDREGKEGQWDNQVNSVKDNVQVDHRDSQHNLKAKIKNLKW